MKAASVLFECVNAASSAQEDEVCENILQRNVMLITFFSSSRIPSLYIRLSTRQNASFRRGKQLSQNQGPIIAL
jgi:hypothetical protein